MSAPSAGQVHLDHHPRGSLQRAASRFGILVALLAGAFLAARFTPLRELLSAERLREVLSFLRGAWWAPFVHVAICVLIGTVGVLTRRNIIVILMSIELILNAVNINLVAFSHYLQNVDGQVFTIFVITDAAAEAAVGLGILIALFRNKETVHADEVDILRW